MSEYLVMSEHHVGTSSGFKAGLGACYRYEHHHGSHPRTIRKLRFGETSVSISQQSVALYAPDFGFLARRAIRPVGLEE